MARSTVSTAAGSMALTSMVADHCVDFHGGCIGGDWIIQTMADQSMGQSPLLYCKYIRRSFKLGHQVSLSMFIGMNRAFLYSLFFLQFSHSANCLKTLMTSRILIMVTLQTLPFFLSLSLFTKI